VGYDLTIGTSASVYDITGTDPDSQTTVFAGKNQSLNDIAQALQVDPNALAQANPQIGDANQHLGPLQQVNVPAVLNPKWPAGTNVPNVTPGGTQPSQPSKTNLPSRPLGASEDATGIMARFQEAWGNTFGQSNAPQASFPNTEAQQSLDENASQSTLPDAETLHSMDETGRQATIADPTSMDPEKNSSEWSVENLPDDEKTFAKVGGQGMLQNYQDLKLVNSQVQAELDNAHQTYLKTGQIPQTKAPLSGIEIEQGHLMSRAERYDAMRKSQGVDPDNLENDDLDNKYMRADEFRGEKHDRINAAIEELNHCSDGVLRGGITKKDCREDVERRHLPEHAAEWDQARSGNGRIYNGQWSKVPEDGVGKILGRVAGTIKGGTKTGERWAEYLSPLDGLAGGKSKVIEGPIKNHKDLSTRTTEDNDRQVKKE
jgi:hypothetical protein